MFLKHFSLSPMSDTMDSYLSVSTLPYSCPFLDLLRVWLCKPSHRQKFFLFVFLFVNLYDPFTFSFLLLSYLNSISRCHLPSQFTPPPQSMAYLTERPSCYVFLTHVSWSTFFLSLPSPNSICTIRNLLGALFFVPKVRHHKFFSSLKMYISHIQSFELRFNNMLPPGSCFFFYGENGTSFLVHPEKGQQEEQRK